jgi:hypothetical protein
MAVCGKWVQGGRGHGVFAGIGFKDALAMATSTLAEMLEMRVQKYEHPGKKKHTPNRQNMPKTEPSLHEPLPVGRTVSHSLLCTTPLPVRRTIHKMQDFN